ncbi:MAG TPA: glycosyltransferase family 4 protein [Cyclobacteriaceae bacterium]|nr:glycosyltransferase family 4 protein [Cyclobacteriaceae bacterium]
MTDANFAPKAPLDGGAKTVVLLSKNFPPVIDGVGDYTFQMYLHLQKKGFKVRVITNVNVDVFNAAENHTENDVFNIIGKWNSSCIKQIMAVLKAEKADWIFLQYVPNSFSRFAVPFFLIALQIRLFFSQTRSAIFFHEVAVRMWSNGVRSFFWGFAQRTISYTLYALSDLSFTSNQFYARYFRPFNIRVVPIPSSVYSDLDYGKKRRSMVSAGPLRVVTFANRCTENLVAAIAQCAVKLHIDLDLRIVGFVQNERRDRIAGWIAQHEVGRYVSFFDGAAAADISNLLNHTDVFLHLEYVSARGEGGICSKSSVVSAAMAAGLPIIGTFGDMTDTTLYKNAENIVFADFDSRDSICNQIQRLYSDLSFRLIIGSNARRSYENFFSWQLASEVFSRALSVK